MKTQNSLKLFVRQSLNSGHVLLWNGFNNEALMFILMVYRLMQPTL